MASATYSLIASTTLSSSQATVTFSSIPSTYTDLVLRMSVRTDASAVFDLVRFQVNSDTNTNYSFTYLYGTGSAAASSATSSAVQYTASYVSAATGTSNTFGSAEVYIPNYATSSNKQISAFGTQENNTTAGYLSSWAELWGGAAAITSINLYPNSGPNFVSGSTFYLYGIKNA